MTGSYQIQLGSKRNVSSIDVDEYFFKNFEKPTMELLPSDQASVIDVAQLFDDERQESEVYRFSGTVNFMSIVNGLKKSYDSVYDFFKRPKLGDEASGATRNLLNSFDIYLCRPLGNTYIGSSVVVTGNTNLGGGTYQLKYEILTNLSSLDTYKSGFAKNIFNDQIHAYNFNVEIDVRDQYDSFNKPLTNLFLFVNFNPQNNKHSQIETVTENLFNGSKVNRPYVVYNGGDIVGGDWVYYLATNFEDVQILRKEYYISFYCTGGTSSSIQFKYNPFIPIKLRDFGDEIITGNISGTSEIDQQIPIYAVKVDNNGNYLWKDLLQNGYIDPISNRGVNYPFINKRHYVFSNTVLPVNVELNDPATAATFAQIKFGPNANQYTQPISDLSNIGKKC